jgi:hypothetical protein
MILDPEESFSVGRKGRIVGRQIGNRLLVMIEGMMLLMSGRGGFACLVRTV